MSYRPHFSISYPDVNTMLSKLLNIWGILEPSHNNGFNNLDQHLLRITLEQLYSKSTGNPPSGLAFKSFLTTVFNRLGESTDQYLFYFLLREREPDDAFILQEAKKDSTNPEINKNDPFPLICRSILLLRLSTGAANNLINNSSINKNDLKFWWETMAYKQGLTPIYPPGIDPIDLFIDIKDSIDEMLFHGVFSDIHNSFNDFPNSMYYLKQFQRPAIWGTLT